MRKLLILAVLGVVAMASANAVTLAFKDAAGVTRTYVTKGSYTGKSETALGAFPITAQVNYNATEKVTGVTNGVAAVVYEITDGKMAVKVQGLPGAEGPEAVEQALTGKITYNRTANGKITNIVVTDFPLDVLGGPMDELNKRLQGAGTGLEFPTRDLKPGDTWSGDFTIDVEGTATKVAMKYTLVGNETVAGKSYAKITTDINLDMPKFVMKADGVPAGLALNMGMKMTGQVTDLFDLQAGCPFSSDMKATIVMKMEVGGMPEATSTTTLNLVSSTTRK